MAMHNVSTWVSNFEVRQIKVACLGIKCKTSDTLRKYMGNFHFIILHDLIVFTDVQSARLYFIIYKTFYAIKIPWLLVRKRTISTERPQLVGEVSGNFCG
jgi:hypothetical protein